MKIGLLTLLFIGFMATGGCRVLRPAPLADSGFYNFCIGDNSCSNVTTERCVIDIRPISHPIPLTYEQVVNIQRLIDTQNRVCGYDPRRTIDDLPRLPPLDYRMQ
jgi:hypothetical protein